MQGHELRILHILLSSMYAAVVSRTSGDIAFTQKCTVRGKEYHQLCFSSRTQSCPLIQGTQGSISLTQDCCPYNLSSHMQNITTSHFLSTSQSTQGTSQPPSLPLVQGFLSRQMCDSCSPVISDPPTRPSITSACANKTFAFKETPSSLIQTWDTLTNTRSGSVYTQLPGFVSNPYKDQYANVCSASLRSHFKGTLCMVPSLLIFSAALPLVTDCSCAPRGPSNPEIAPHSITSAYSHPDSCCHWETGQGALLEDTGVG